MNPAAVVAAKCAAEQSLNKTLGLGTPFITTLVRLRDKVGVEQARPQRAHGHWH